MSFISSYQTNIKTADVFYNNCATTY